MCLDYMIVPQKKHELRNQYDKYLTPYSLTQQLLDCIELDKNIKILEPCSSTEGCIVKVLRDNGFTNVIENIYDPLKPETDIINLPDDSCEVIITNTPYGKTIIPFVKKMKKISTQMVIALYPISTLHSTKRFNQLWNDDEYGLSEVLMFSRPPLLKDTIQDDSKYNTGMNAYGWFIWKKGCKSNDVKLRIIDNSMFCNRKKN